MRERNGHRQRPRVKHLSGEARGTGYVSREGREVELLQAGPQLPQRSQGATCIKASADVRDS